MNVNASLPVADSVVPQPLISGDFVGAEIFVEAELITSDPGSLVNGRVRLGDDDLSDGDLLGSDGLGIELLNGNPGDPGMGTVPDELSVRTRIDGFNLMDFLSEDKIDSFTIEAGAPSIPPPPADPNDPNNPVFPANARFKLTALLQGGGMRMTDPLALAAGQNTVGRGDLNLLPGDVVVGYTVEVIVNPQSPVGLTLNSFSVQTTATVVPLPAATWMALPLLGGLGVTQLIRRRRLAA